MIKGMGAGGPHALDRVECVPTREKSMVMITSSPCWPPAAQPPDASGPNAGVGLAAAGTAHAITLTLTPSATGLHARRHGRWSRPPGPPVRVRSRATGWSVNSHGPVAPETARSACCTEYVTPAAVHRAACALRSPPPPPAPATYAHARRRGRHHQLKRPADALPAVNPAVPPAGAGLAAVRAAAGPRRRGNRADRLERRGLVGRRSRRRSATPFPRPTLCPRYLPATHLLSGNSAI